MRVLRRFIINGLIMTVTSIALRTLGVAFNAFVSRRLGADGMGLFTLIMSVYGLAVTAASSGVNLAATRMCAEALGRGCEKSVHGALKRCFAYALFCGTGAFLVLFKSAEYISVSWLGDIRCMPSLRFLAVSLPFIAMSNVLHGYFTAVRKVSKSAVTQIFEQLFRTFVCVFGLLHIVPEGIEYSCMALVGGGAIAEIASFLMALILYLADRRGLSKSKLSHAEGNALTREMFGITIPVAAAAYVRSGLSTLEHMLIPRGLRMNPVTADTALAAYGVLCGMVMPIIMFPSALLYSFTGLLIPEFAEAEAKGSSERINSMISRSLGLTLIFSIGCSALIAVFSNELGMLIYNSHEAGDFIKIMAPLIPVMYLDHAVDAILKGLGEQLYCMKVNIADAALCTFLVWILCPRIGIYGYILTVYLAELLNASFSLGKLMSVSQFRLRAADHFIKPVLCAAGAIITAQFMGAGGSNANWLSLALSGAASAAVYLLLLTLTEAVKYKKPPHRLANASDKTP